MTKEAVTNMTGGQYVLNSYAFHSRQIISTLSSYLPAGFEKSKIENLFVEIDKESDQFEKLLFTDNPDKIRKRALISSTFATAYRVKHVTKVFQDLRNCKLTAPQLFKRVATVPVATTFTIPSFNAAQKDCRNDLNLVVAPY